MRQLRVNRSTSHRLSRNGAAAFLAVAAMVVGSTAAALPAAAAAQPYAAHLTRAPYLTDLVGLHVAINYATDRSSTNAAVTYGRYRTSSGCSLTTTVKPTRTAISVGTVREYQWTAHLTLPVRGEYCYRVFLGGVDLLGANPSPKFITQVQPGDTTRYSFAVIGDWGLKTNGDQAAVMAGIANSGARFAITVGDNGYPNGNQIDYGDLQQTGTTTSAVFGPNMWTVAGDHIPLFPTVGNHGLTGPSHTDITTWTEAQAVASSGGTYQNTTYCCVAGTTSMDEASEWYAFTAGNARFYMLDATWPDNNPGTSGVYAADAAAHWATSSPEYQWLVNDLRAHPTQLKFAFFHYPLYSDVSTAPSDTYLNGATHLEGLLASNGVQMIFNGHAHVYQRNRPSGPGMPITYVTGNGGGTLQPLGRCSANDMYAIGWSNTTARGTACGSAPVPTNVGQIYGFLKVSVSGTTVTVTPTNALGQTFDVQSYHFVAAPDTYITSAPAALTNQTSATIKFHASATVASYTCSLDGAPGTACTSPFVTSGLVDGDHTFSVAATVGGEEDPTPAQANWTVDTAPPTVPTGVQATATTSTQVQVTWSTATDDSGISGYQIVRDGALYRTVGATTSFTDAVASGSSHTYAVAATDNAGNTSAPSAPVSVTSGSSTGAVFSDGFESGNFAAWTLANGLQIESTLVAAGSHAAQSAASAATGPAYAKKMLSGTYSNGYLGAMVNIGSHTQQINLIRLRSAAGASLGFVYITGTGRIGMHADASDTTITSSTIMPSGWHLIQLRLATDTSPGTATGALQVWLDNEPISILSKTAIDTGSAPIGQIQIGEVQAGRGYPVTYDNVGFGTTLASGS
jgi:hypothetical protein